MKRLIAVLVAGLVVLAFSDLSWAGWKDAQQTVLVLSGNTDNLSGTAVSVVPQKRIGSLRVVSTGGAKNYTVHQGDTLGGNVLWQTYLNGASAGTTTVLESKASFVLPATGVFLVTDDTSTSGALYITIDRP